MASKSLERRNQSNPFLQNQIPSSRISKRTKVLPQIKHRASNSQSQETQLKPRFFGVEGKLFQDLNDHSQSQIPEQAETNSKLQVPVEYQNMNSVKSGSKLNKDEKWKQILNSKDQWFYQNLVLWILATPDLEDLHRIKDLEHHIEKASSPSKINQKLQQILTTYDKETERKGNNASPSKRNFSSDRSSSHTKFQSKHQTNRRQGKNKSQINFHTPSDHSFPNLLAQSHNFSKQQSNYQPYSQLEKSSFGRKTSMQLNQESPGSAMDRFFRFKDPATFNYNKHSSIASNLKPIMPTASNFYLSQHSQQANVASLITSVVKFDQNLKSFITQHQQQEPSPPRIQEKPTFGLQGFRTGSFGEELGQEKEEKQVLKLRNVSQNLDKIVAKRAKINNLLWKQKQELLANSGKKKQPKQMELQSDPANSTKRHMEVEKWARQYNLHWKQIYELESEFQSLLKIEGQDNDIELQKFLQERNFIDFSSSVGSSGQAEKKIEQKLGDVEEGITLKTFLEYAKVLSYKQPRFTKHIIQAFGIDQSNKNSKITWESFILLKCFLELFTLPTEDLKKYWIKVLDPFGLRHLPAREFSEFLEIIARGSTTIESTLISRTFATKLMKLFELEGCLSENGQEILIERVKDRLERDVFDVELFNQVLQFECMYIVESKNYPSSYFEE